MSRLFWLVLSAVRKGCRYLRGFFRLDPALAARGQSAPGSAAAARLRRELADLQGAGVSRPGSNADIAARISGGDLLAHMVAWLVALGRFPGQTRTELVIGLQASPAADMNGAWPGIVELVRQIESCPGIPMALCRRLISELESNPVMAPPAPMETRTQVPFADLDAAGTDGMPAPGSITMDTASAFSAAQEPGFPEVFACAAAYSGTGLTARMTVSIPAQWVDGKNLYIRQVYETQWDGDMLVLH